MSHHVVCPQCQASLRSARPFPAAQQLRCPRSGGHFFASNSPPKPLLVMPATDVTPSVQRGSTLIFAGVAAILLTGAGIGGTVFYFLHNRPIQPTVAKEEPKDLRAEEERTKLEAERTKLAEQIAAFEEVKRLQKNKQELARLLEKGKEALAGKHYADALAAYGDALKLFPEDADAKKGLILAQTALATSERGDEDRTKQKDAYNRLMADGAKAREDKQYAAAVQSYQAALLVLPNDEAAAKALTEVSGLLAKNEDENKKLLGFKFHMEAGNDAMVRQNYQLALNNFVAAQAFLPGNPDAIKGMKAAQDRLETLQDRAKKQADAQGLIAKGRAARAAQNFDQAIDAFQSALKLAPDDRDAQQGLAEATKTRDALKAEFTQKMTLGQNALQLQRFADALAAFRAAAQIFPEDQTAQRGMRLAQQGLDGAAIGATALVTLQTYLDQGRIALAAHRYADANVAFTAALQISPNDPTALAGLLTLKQFVDVKAQRLLDITRLLNLGAQALQAQRFPDAIKAYKDVLLLDSDNLQASNGLRTARYQKAMLDGQQALLSRRYIDAVSFFEAALIQVPGDPTAANSLKAARMKVK